MKNASAIFRVYLALAAFVGLIGAVIGYGTFGYEFAKSRIISDDEYIAGQRSYEIKACEDPTIAPPTKEGGVSTSVKRTPSEIEACKIETRARVLTERRYQLKDSAISGGVWGTLFFLVFLGHYPFLLRTRKEEK